MAIGHLVYPLFWIEGSYIILRDLFKFSNPVFNSMASLRSSVDWLLKANRAVGGKGFSASYSLLRGWSKAYPETTGYIIPTLLNFASMSGYRRDEVTAACQKSGEWLLSIQNEDGSFSELFDQSPAVFDTGEILFGLSALYKYIRQEEYLAAVRKAADWLVANQWDNGAWGRSSIGKTSDVPYSYTSRPAWALLVAYEITGDAKYRKLADKNLGWVVSQQASNGWFQHSYWKESNESFLHTIAYTLDGLINGGIILKDKRYLGAVRKTAHVLVELSKKNDLKSYYDNQWQSTDPSFCLTGLSQVAVVLKKLYRVYPEEKYLTTAHRIDRLVASKQIMNRALRNLYGGIAGSCPIWGRFVGWNFVNWAVKFQVDSLLLSKEIDNQETVVLFPG